MNKQQRWKALWQVLILSGLFLGISVMFGVAIGALATILHAVLGIKSEFLRICVSGLGMVLVLAWILRRIQGSTTFTSIHAIQQERIAQLSPEQRSAYRRVLSFNIAVAFLLPLVIGIISYYLLPLLQVFVFGRQPDTIFFIPIFPLSFGALSAFGLMPILFFFFEPLSQRIAREHWESIRDIINLHVPGTEHISDRVMGYVFLPLTFICWGLLILCFFCYARVTPQGLAINRFWSLRETFYSYREIKDVVYVTRIKTRFGYIEPASPPYYRVYFRDGTVFQTLNTALRGQNALSRKVMGTIARQSGVSIREGTLNLDADGPLSPR